MEAAVPESARRGVATPSSEADARRRRAFIYGLIAWNGYLSLSASHMLPNYDFVGFSNYADLFDSDRFRRHIEAAYQTMWERYQKGEQPASFAVDAIK